MRKVITLVSRLAEQYNIDGWRQNAYNIRQLKRLMRIAQNKKKARGKTEKQRADNLKKVKQAHKEYVEVSKRYLDKVNGTIEQLPKIGLDSNAEINIENIKKFVGHSNRQIEQIERRVLHGVIIPHHEKVFSIFEPHTEWVVKGKAGVPVELGLRVCIVEDQYRFILHHQVMEKQNDEQIAVALVKKAKQLFPLLSAVSFDRGFHSVSNQEFLSKEVDLLALPRKGKLSKAAIEIEQSEVFKKARRRHAAVESAINALEVHGLDQCPDHGLTGFKRYVALAILARNIQCIGAILQKQEQRKIARTKSKEQHFNKLLEIAA